MNLTRGNGGRGCWCAEGFDWLYKLVFMFFFFCLDRFLFLGVYWSYNISDNL